MISELHMCMRTHVSGEKKETTVIGHKNEPVHMSETK